MFRLPISLVPQIAPTSRPLCVVGGRAVYTTPITARWRSEAVASLRALIGQLARRDLHPLDRSLVGYSRFHTPSHTPSPAGRKRSLWPLKYSPPSGNGNASAGQAAAEKDHSVVARSPDRTTWPDQRSPPWAGDPGRLLS